MSKRKPAKTINEFVNNLFLGALTQEQADFYVPFYDQKIRQVRDSLIYDELVHQTIYFLGQVGTGKTTALNFLPNEVIKEKYHVVSIYANLTLDMNDVDIADVLLVICNKLMEGNAKVRKKFEKEIESIERSHEGTREIITLKEEGIKKEGSIGLEGSLSNPFARFLGFFKVQGNLLANMRMDTNTRRMVRDMFNVRPSDIFEMTNKIVDAYLEQKKGDKQLLIIFNELDHIRDADSIMRLFIDNRYYLNNLRCKKIISVPVVLNMEAQFQKTQDVDRKYLGLKIKSNPILKITPKRKKLINENRQLLRQLALNRIDESVDLIDMAALDLAIDQSGGLIRQYINILADAGRSVRLNKGTKISKEDIDFAASDLREDLEGSLIEMEKIKLLEQIRLKSETKTTPANKDLLVEAFLANQIIIVKNKPTWYYLNPLIEKTVEIYARNIDKDDD